MQGTRSLADVKKQLEVWRKKGPIGKLHNIVTFIRRTPQRREQFRSMNVSQVNLDAETMKDLMVNAQAFLYGKDEEAFTAEVQGTRSLADVKKQLEVWRKKGPIGKLHNIVTFIRRTPQRREQFRSMDVSQVNIDAETMKDLMVICDNDTR